MTAPAQQQPAADCHVHIFDPKRFPYRRDAAYRPAPHETAPVEQLLAVLDAHGLSHALLVTPTAGYAPDNGAAMAAIRDHPHRLRGIAVVETDTDEDEISRLKSAGFVGVRFDLIGQGVEMLIDRGRRLLSILREQDMVLDLQTEGALLDSAVLEILWREAGRLVIDHMGRPDALAGLDQPGFAALLRLADRDGVAVKLSGPFRFSAAGFPYADSDRFAGAILRAFGPERCVWGSDWPFVRMDRRVDYGPSLAALDRWLPDATARRTVLWETPRRLFGFQSGF